MNANNGLDMEQPGDYILIGNLLQIRRFFNNAVTNIMAGGAVFGGGGLKNAVNRGEVSQARLNEMVGRVLAPWLKLGQDQGYPPVNFDSQKPDGSGPRNLNVVVRSNQHTALAREIASASAVLLKNAPSTSRGLPLDFSKLRNVAIVGQDAKMPKKDCNDLNECNEGTMSVGWGSGSNSLEYIIPPVDAITNELKTIGNNAVVNSSLSNDVNAGVNAARGKDVAFVFANA